MIKKLFISITILLISILLFFSKTIFQEGNPIPVLYGIIKLNLTNENVIQISDKNNKYITKSENGRNDIIKLMKEKGYKFSEQMGAGYIFENNNKQKIIITQRLYSRLYNIWNFPKN